MFAWIRRLFGRRSATKERLELLAQRRDIQRAIAKKGGEGVDHLLALLNDVETRLGWYPPYAPPFTAAEFIRSAREAGADSLGLVGDPESEAALANAAKGDFLDELIEERTAQNPNFPKLVKEEGVYRRMTKDERIVFDAMKRVRDWGQSDPSLDAVPQSIKDDFVIVAKAFGDWGDDPDPEAWIAHLKGNNAPLKAILDEQKEADDGKLKPKPRRRKKNIPV